MSRKKFGMIMVSYTPLFVALASSPLVWGAAARPSLRDLTAYDATVCSPAAPICIRGSPGTPGPGKDTLKKFTPDDPESANLGACCAAASTVPDVLAVQLVKKSGQSNVACWLMGQTHASSTMKAQCTSAMVAKAPTPVPRREGPPQLPFQGSARGIVNLGGGPPAAAADPVFERFQQIDLQWSDIEPEEGVYNWTLPESLALAINASGRMAVYKVNANYKPAWLYEKVPWSNTTWTAEQMDGKTAMYWHPTYIEAMTRRIAAQAQWLAASPHGKLYAYVRQTWAAIGEEGLGIPMNKGAAVAALRDGKNWIVPSGCVPKSACAPPPSYDAGNKGTTALSSPTDVAYLAAIGDAWINAFNRTVQTEWRGVLLLRANGYDTRWANITTAMMSTGGFGWFQTGAGMTESQCFNQTFRYAPFRRDCLTEHGVVCFAESCGMQQFAGPDQTGTPGLRASNFSRIQGAYWELLSNMASGVHVCGVHSSTFLNTWMAQRNFASMYSWADAYIGLHASPEFAPGAWIAFRPADREGKTPTTLIGDYGFLMQRLSGLKRDTSIGEEKCGTSWEEGNASTPYGAWCRSLPSGGAVALTLDPALARIFATTKNTTVRFVYSVGVHSNAAAAPRLEVRYDNGAAGGAVAITTAAGGGAGDDKKSSWRDVSVRVMDAVFSRGGANGADVWVTNLGAEAAVIHMVEVAH